MAEKKSNLRKNFDWYYANLRRLLPKYRGRVDAEAECAIVRVYGNCTVFIGGEGETAFDGMLDSLAISGAVER